MPPPGESTLQLTTNQAAAKASPLVRRLMDS